MNEYFLKSIFQAKDIDIEENLITKAVSAMSHFVMPQLISDSKYNLFYSVNFDDLKTTDINEEQALGLRQHGWVLDDNEKYIIRPI